MITEKGDGRIKFGDILEYVPNERKEKFIHDIVLYVPHLKEEADKFSHVIHNVAVGVNMRKYIDIMKEVAKFIYTASGEDNRKRENVSYRHLIFWMMHKTLPVTLAGIGSEFLKKNHATVMHGISCFENTIQISWKDRMIIQCFVETMDSKGFPQPKTAYKALLNKLKLNQ